MTLDDLLTLSVALSDLTGRISQHAVLSVKMLDTTNERGRPHYKPMRPLGLVSVCHLIALALPSWFP